MLLSDQARLLSQLAVLPSRIPFWVRNIILSKHINGIIASFVRVAGVKDFHQDLNGFTLVDESDECKVNLPVKWFPLAPGEQLVAVAGQAYQVSSFFEKLNLFCSKSKIVPASIRTNSIARV
jgi:hypothetical protein